MGKTITIWIILILIGMPIGFSLIFITFAYLIGNQMPELYFIGDQIITGLNNFTLLSVPFFIFTGFLMNGSGITERIFNFANSCAGHITGSLGHVNVLASILFSGMSGSALADAAGLGQLEVKSMRDAKFDDDVSGGLTAASCIIGPLIPPSIPLVIYGVVSNSSIAALFLAGAIPGLLCGVALMITIYFIAKRRGYKTLPRVPWSGRFVAFKKAFLSLLTPVIIVGGIFSGKFTPTEAAVISSIYALFLSFVVYRSLTLKELYVIINKTIVTTAVAGLLIVGVVTFGYIVTLTQLPQILAQGILDISSNKIVVLLIINLLLLFLGTFIEALALLLLLIPFLVPVVVALGVNPVQFGIIAILNLMIGILTPPLGMALYVVSRVANIPFHIMVKGIIPFLIPLLIVLLLVILVPEISLWLPGALGYLS